MENEYKEQRDRLLDFIKSAPVSSGVCCCGDAMDSHSDPMYCGHSAVDMWDNAVVGFVREFEAYDMTHMSLVPQSVEEVISNVLDTAGPLESKVTLQKDLLHALESFEIRQK